MIPQAAVRLTDDEAFPHPYLKAMLDRLRSELDAAASALRGELLAAFWQSIDELLVLRRDPAATLSDAVPKRLVGLDSEHQKALLMRLRIDAISVAKSLHGDLIATFWRDIDALCARRPTSATKQ